MGNYKIINSANIKKTKPISILVQFFLYCKDSLGCIDNNNIKLINNIVLLRDVFHIGLVIGPRPAVLA